MRQGLVTAVILTANPFVCFKSCRGSPKLRGRSLFPRKPEANSLIAIPLFAFPADRLFIVLVSILMTNLSQFNDRRTNDILREALSLQSRTTDANRERLGWTTNDLSWKGTSPFTGNGLLIHISKLRVFCEYVGMFWRIASSNL